MEKNTISILVENNPGVLSRVVSLFSRRGYNIDSLTVGETEDKSISRMTIALSSDEQSLEQIVKQLHKIIDVIKIIELNDNKSVYRELALIKVKATSKNRSEIIEISNLFKAHIVDVSNENLIVEVTGEEEKINRITSLLAPYGIKEFIRTGITGLQRG